VNPNDLAYPSHIQIVEERRWPLTQPQCTDGLTKRELIAAMALQGMLASSAPADVFRQLALDAVTCADALIAELSK
jgi:hypothetical protein